MYAVIKHYQHVLLITGDAGRLFVKFKDTPLFIIDLQTHFPRRCVRVCVRMCVRVCARVRMSMCGIHISTYLIV